MSLATLTINPPVTAGVMYMNIIIEGSQNLDISSPAELSKLLPPSLDGEVLNYGQGEGQVKIAGTVWGLYVRTDGKYYLQYEEGVCDWLLFQRIASALMEQMASTFGRGLEFKVEGKLEHYMPHEKYT